MTLTHPLQEKRLVAAVMDQVRGCDLRKDAEEIVPYQLLLFCIIGPETVLNASFGGWDAYPDQVVEIAVGHSFDIKKDGSAFELCVRNFDGVNFVLADRKRPQGMIMFLLLAFRSWRRRRGRNVCDSWVTVKMPLPWSRLRSFSDIPDSRLSSSFSIACLRQRVWNSHWPQCWFSTRHGGELLARSAVMSLIRFRTLLAKVESSPLA